MLHRSANEEGATQHSLRRGPKWLSEVWHRQNTSKSCDRAAAVPARQQGFSQIHQQVGGGLVTSNVDRCQQSLFGPSDGAGAQGSAAGLGEHHHGLLVSKHACPRRVLGCLRRVGARRGEQAEGAGVPATAECRGNFVVDELPEQRMRELRPARGIGFEHAALAERLERSIALRWWKLGHRRRDRRPEAASQHTRRLRIPHIVGRCTREPGAQQPGLGCDDVVTGFGNAAAPTDGRGNLFHQERVSRGEPRCSPGRRRRHGADPGAQHFGGARGAEWPETLDNGVTIVRQRADHVERVARPGPKGSDNSHREAADSAAQERQQRKRIVVRPVEVIEQDQGRRGQVLEKLQSGIQPCGPRLQRRCSAGLRHGRAAESESAERLVDGAKGQGRFSGVGSSDAELELTAAGGGGALEHRGLAEASFTDDEQAAPESLARLGEQALDLPHGRIALPDSCRGHASLPPGNGNA